jgi:hypothetical protein
MMWMSITVSQDIGLEAHVEIIGHQISSAAVLSNGPDLNWFQHGRLRRACFSINPI